MSAHPETIWGVTPDDAVLRNLLDMKEFENLFQAKARVTALDASPVSSETDLRRRGTRTMEISLLDPKKAYNIGIIISRMRMPFSEIRQCLLSMDERRPTNDELKALLTVVPTADEVCHRGPAHDGRASAAER